MFPGGSALAGSCPSPANFVRPLLAVRPSGHKALGLHLAGDCAPTNVAPAERALPMNEVDGAIGARLRFGNGRTRSGDVEHAAAGGENAAVLSFGTGVEDLDAVEP